MSEINNQSWSVIILCYNEEGSIKRVINDVQQILRIISPDKNEIVLINDGSTDNSGRIIEELIKNEINSNIKYLCHSNNKGIGESLKNGYKNSTCENVVMIPGDGQFDLKEFIPYKNFPPKSILAFYRVENTTYSFSRNILSWINKFLNRLFTGIELKDVNWVKVYKNADLQKLDLQIKSSLIESEICSKLIQSGHQPIEIESSYLPRENGKSKGASFKIILQAMMDIFRLFIVTRRFKK